MSSLLKNAFKTDNVCLKFNLSLEELDDLVEENKRGISEVFVECDKEQNDLSSLQELQAVVDATHEAGMTNLATTVLANTALKSINPELELDLPEAVKISSGPQATDTLHNIATEGIGSAISEMIRKMKEKRDRSIAESTETLGDMREAAKAYAEKLKDFKKDLLKSAQPTAEINLTSLSASLKGNFADLKGVESYLEKQADRAFSLYKRVDDDFRKICELAINVEKHLDLSSDAAFKKTFLDKADAARKLCVWNVFKPEHKEEFFGGSSITRVKSKDGYETDTGADFITTASSHNSRYDFKADMAEKGAGPDLKLEVTKKQALDFVEKAIGFIDLCVKDIDMQRDQSKLYNGPLWTSQMNMYLITRGENPTQNMNKLEKMSGEFKRHHQIYHILGWRHYRGCDSTFGFLSDMLWAVGTVSVSISRRLANAF